MKPFTRTISLIALIAVSAVSGALAGAAFDRAAVAAVALPVQDPELTNLLKYVKVDSAGNVTINANNFTLAGSGVNIKAAASLQMLAGANLNIEGAGAAALTSGGGTTLTAGGGTTIKGTTVSVCCNATVR